MLSRRNSINFSFERVAYYIERISKNAFVNLGIGLFITISTISSWDTWYATINNGKVELHHGITVAGIWQVLASLPDVFRSLHQIYQKLRKRRKPVMKLTLLHVIEVLMEVVKKIIVLHRAGVEQKIINEIHACINNIKDTVEKHYHDIKETVEENIDGT